MSSELDKQQEFEKEFKALLKKYDVSIEKEYDYYDEINIVAVGKGIYLDISYL